MIPSFCTTQPFLRITLIATSKMAAVLPLAWKEQRWAAFAERKLFIRNKNAANRRTASSSGLKKTRKTKKCASSGSLLWISTSRPSSCRIKCPRWSFGRGLWSLWGSSTALQLWARITTLHTYITKPCPPFTTVYEEISMVTPDFFSGIC